MGPWPATRPERPDLFAANEARVLEAVRHASHGRGPLRFAFAKREITPLPGEPLAGYGERWSAGKACIGAEHPLWCRALGLAAGDEVVCLVSLDLLCLTRQVRDEALAALAQRSHLPGSNVLFSATHTHSGPGGYSNELVARAFLGAPCRASRERIVRAIAESVDDATRPLLEGHGRRASARFARTNVPQFVRNRLLKTDEPVDAALAALEVDALEPGPLPSHVVLVSYGAHATVLGPDNLLASGDYPGALVEALDGDGPDAMLLSQPDPEAMFLAGGVGSQAPRPPERSPEGARRLGALLAGEVRTSLASPSTVALVSSGSETDLAAVEAEIDLPHASPKIGRFRVSPWLAGTQVASEASLRFVRLGNLVVAATPGDLSGELSVRAKTAIERDGRLLLPVSFSGDYHGYLLPEDRADLPGYEPTMMWHGPQQGELALNALVTGARALLDAR